MRVLFLLSLSLFIVGCFDSDSDDISLSDLQGTWNVKAYTGPDASRAARDVLDGESGKVVIDSKGYIEVYLTNGTDCYELDYDFMDSGYKIKDLGDGKFEVEISPVSTESYTENFSASFSGDNLQISFDDKKLTVSEANSNVFDKCEDF